MTNLKGGCSCGCGCLYAGSGGGSSSGKNMVANSQKGLHSSTSYHYCSCGATGYSSGGNYYWQADWYSGRW